MSAPALPSNVEPIIFVHGNGDSRASWITTAWRFESNGWPRDRLFALNLAYPLARNDDTVPMASRSSAAEFDAALAGEVARVRAVTGASKVILIGLSRGGYPIRSYVASTNGATVSHVILGGTPNHGVFATQANQNSEFNGAGPYLRALNQAGLPLANETTDGVAFLTVRSDGNDKYAQPLAIGIGAPAMATNVDASGPSLRGATNVVIAGIDHRETATSEAAFAEDFRFLTGHAPNERSIVPEQRVVLDGQISVLAGADPTNLPMAGAYVEVYQVNPVDGRRYGSPFLHRTTDADGKWGPFNALPDAYYEFVVSGPGCATTHIYRSPFPRSSNWVDLRCSRDTDADAPVGTSYVTMSRPRGYFGLGRDRMSLDGAPPPGVMPGVPLVSTARIAVQNGAAGTTRAVIAEFNGERIAVQSWPAREHHVVIAEFQY